MHRHTFPVASAVLAILISQANPSLAQPTSTATGIKFEDSDLERGMIGGKVTIIPADSDSGISHYVLYWSRDGEFKDERIEAFQAKDEDLEFTIPAGTPSTKADLLTVYTADSSGQEMSLGVSVKIVDNWRLINSIQSLIFKDEDPSRGEYAGDIIIQDDPDQRQRDTVQYRIYWARQDTSSGQIELLGQGPIGVLNVDETVLRIAPDTRPPADATHIAVTASAGESTGHIWDSLPIAFKLDPDMLGCSCDNLQAIPAGFSDLEQVKDGVECFRALQLSRSDLEETLDEDERKKDTRLQQCVMVYDTLRSTLIDKYVDISEQHSLSKAALESGLNQSRANEILEDVNNSEQVMNTIEGAIDVKPALRERRTLNAFLGAEAAAIDALNNGLPRIELSYTTPSEKFGVRLLQTGSAEQTEEAQSNVAPEEVEKEQLSTTEIEIAWFVPWWRLLGGPESESFGIVYIAGARSVLNADDGEDDVLIRSYGGFRWRLPEAEQSYVDMLYGWSEGLNPHRFELRVQGPIDFRRETPVIYFGAVLNTAWPTIDVAGKRVDKSRAEENTEDPESLRFYVTYRVAFSDVFQSR